MSKECCSGGDCCDNGTGTGGEQHSHDHGVASHDHGHGHGHKEAHAESDCCSGGHCSGGGGNKVGNHSHGHGHGHEHADGKLSVLIQYCDKCAATCNKFSVALQAFLEDEFGDKIKVTSEGYPGPEHDAFEVFVGGQLAHSKLTISGHKKVQTDEELDSIIAIVNGKLGK